jgi:threonine dehydratase
LIGVQIPEKEQDEFQHFLEALGYAYWKETNNPAYQLFLK